MIFIFSLQLDVMVSKEEEEIMDDLVKKSLIIRLIIYLYSSSFRWSWSIWISRSTRWVRMIKVNSMLIKFIESIVGYRGAKGEPGPKGKCNNWVRFFYIRKIVFYRWTWPFNSRPTWYWWLSRSIRSSRIKR